MPEPKLLDSDVLVQIHAAGVNPLDNKIRDEEFKLILPFRLPFILGNEVAGIVVKVGPRARNIKPGDEVYARPDKDRIGTPAHGSARPWLRHGSGAYPQALHRS
jgi:NADPH:quinone reductase-like Zn-dependent oxidoreductase